MTFQAKSVKTTSTQQKQATVKSENQTKSEETKKSEAPSEQSKPLQDPYQDAAARNPLEVPTESEASDKRS